MATSCAKQTPEPAESLAAHETFEQQEARLDATVWRNELLALKHEKVFFALRDQLRAASNKIEALARFPFGDIILPNPSTEPELLPLSIRKQRFDDAQPNRLSHQEWEDKLGRLAAAGFSIDDAEWTHERFMPAAQTNSAISEFHFELHGQRADVKSRFTITGNLRVEWSDFDGTPPPKARRLTVSGVTGLGRTGPPGFAKIGVVTPSAPEKRGDFVELHPLIVADVNGDGYDDILMGGINQLLLNKGDATFSAGPLIDEKFFHGSRVIGGMGDFTGDGIPDYVTVASHGSVSNQLVLHIGNGRFPISGEPIIACPGIHFAAPAAITFGDIDGDGDLDLWIGQYKQPYSDGQMPTPYYDADDGFPSYLLMNDGTGHFKIAGADSGLSAKSHRRVIAASLADVNNDGRLDLLTVNDFSGADLFYGEGNGRFKDETRRLYNRSLYGMAHCFADFDGDGVLDFFVTGMSLPTVRRLEAMKLGREDMPDRTRRRLDMTYGNRVYALREGHWAQPSFSDELARTGWTWGVAASDFDNDGAVDLYLANGNISGASVEDYDSHYWRHDIYLGNSQPNRDLFVYFARQFDGINSGRTSYVGHQRNVLLLDAGANHYVNIAHLMDVANEADCRAVVGADLDNDGRPDLVVTEMDRIDGPFLGRNRLLIHRNVLATGNHWIGAKLSWGKKRSIAVRRESPGEDSQAGLRRANRFGNFVSFSIA